MNKTSFYTRNIKKNLRGFTLIELMVVVTVIGILSGIAYPSYVKYVQKSRRSEAIAAIAQVQQAQEKWRSNNAAYAGNAVLTTAWPNGLGMSANTSSGGYYTIAITTSPAPTGTSYTVTATAVSGKSQANDTGCVVLTSSLQSGTWTNTPSTCWSQ